MAIISELVAENLMFSDGKISNARSTTSTISNCSKFCAGIFAKLEKASAILLIVSIC